MTRHNFRFEITIVMAIATTNLLAGQSTALAAFADLTGWAGFNNTSGAFAINLKLSNSGTRFGTGVAPTQTKKAFFYHTNPSTGGASGDILKSTADI